jgi:uncharacterized protein
MSALTCPVCQGSFREVLREGILIDVCNQCRGVWLDRGELEKLLSLSRGASDEAPVTQPQAYEPPRQPQPYEQQPHAQSKPVYRRDDDDDDDRRKHGHGEYDKYGNKKKKKGFDFGDIFDFGD